MNDWDYIYAVARIKVREKDLLSSQEISQLVSMPSETAVREYLASKNYDVDTMEAETMALMKELGVEETYFDVLSYPELFHNAKAGIKEVVTSEEHPKAFYPLEGFGRAEVLKILNEKDYEHLPAILQKVVPEAFAVMLKTRDGQVLDVMMDRACLEATEEAAKKSKSPLFKDYALSKVALSNIKVAARAKKMGKSRDFLDSALSDSSRIDIEGLKEAVLSEDENALYTFMEKQGLKEGAEALKTSGAAFERWCDNHLIETLRAEKDHYESVGPLLAYYLARQNEVKTLRIILTGKANGFSDEMIRERVREMYV